MVDLNTEMVAVSRANGHGRQANGNGLQANGHGLQANGNGRQANGHGRQANGHGHNGVNGHARTDQDDISALHASWIWVSDWLDADPKPSTGSSPSIAPPTAGRLVTFTRTLHLRSVPSEALIQCTADTRYKLLVNGTCVAVGPSRSAPECWLYDTIDLAPYLDPGENVITFVVIRYFYANRAGMAFVRTGFPGLAVTGVVGGEDIGTGGGAQGWTASVDYGTRFPSVLDDDVFLHISERGSPTAAPAHIEPYSLRLTNGELAPWRLQPRLIPMQEQKPVRLYAEPGSDAEWSALLAKGRPLSLGTAAHTVVLQAAEHSTAFLRWTFRSCTPTRVHLRVTYSEAYEREPRRYPWLRVKDDRLDSSGLILGPHDEITLELDGDGETTYEPFWFRTFRLLAVEVRAETDAGVEIVAVRATQTNYPLDVKAKWDNPSDKYAGDVFDISVRTMRNCMFDAYSDCPFYEQLSYSGDSRSVGLFHYLLSGDDRLVRQTITSFAGSITPEGLTQSRYPSHVKQLIAGFPLYWVLTICDHYLYFGDRPFARALFPRIDGVLDLFDRHVDARGLVSGLPRDVWQYVDWVTGWDETATHADKGVPTAGRASNTHTYFSMLYAWTLQHAAVLADRLGRPHASEYRQRSDELLTAIRTHCYDSTLQIYTDSTSDQPNDTPGAYSQHCQVFAVLCGAHDPADAPRLLRRAFAPTPADRPAGAQPQHYPVLGKCSYVMMFYAFRAFAQAGIYEEQLHGALAPWRRMISQRMSTWEEDDVRQRSDCHAWGSVPVYEYLSEIAGVQPLEPGCSKILFAPRTALTPELTASVALGRDNVAHVSWKSMGGRCLVRLMLDRPVEVVTKGATGGVVEHGFVSTLEIDL